MISGAEVILLVVVAVSLYLIFNVITMPATLRNIIGIVLGIVLAAIIINVLFGVFPL